MAERWIDRSEIESRADDIARLAAQTPDILAFCSSLDWQLAAADAFSPKSQQWLLEIDDRYAILFSGRETKHCFMWEPLETSWGFGCPILGPDLPAALAAFLDLKVQLTTESRHQPVIFQVDGLPRDSSLFAQLCHQQHRELQRIPSSNINVIIANLEGGAEAYLARRSSKFRNNLKRYRRRADDRGIRFEAPTKDEAPESIFRRILQVEKRSWKAGAGRSIFFNRECRHFYAMLAQRLASTGRLRTLFARHDEVDIAYIFGGVLHDEYKGFQLAYDDGYAALGLGHLAQWAMISNLAAEGIRTYDLGMDMPYKREWGDQQVELIRLLLF